MIATDTPVTLGRMRECGVDPVELQNLVDNLKGSTDSFANAVAAGTATPETP